MARALILVHDPDPARQRRIPGTVLPVLEDLGFEVRLATFTAGGAVPDPADVDRIVVMGSAEAAYDDTLPWLAPELAFLRAATAHGTPTLGICFGGQALSRSLGGTVGRAPRPERGFTDLDTGRWMEFHYDAFTLPPGATELLRNDVALQAFALGPHLGLQFHPEITLDVFACWTSGWSPAVAAAVAAEVDLDAVRAEIVDRAETSAKACRALVADWVQRTSTGSVSTP
ncbi:hypothetical protein GCM10009836_17520 [Pseudonocardia ailaonensis]|uniref:Glutamine amidotransferase domain-containing protein n=1 Tax=Pseudonocardia ailaonensis TaxID=367279 RepID=A0ABN2MXJ8_9PSEU